MEGLKVEAVLNVRVAFAKAMPQAFELPVGEKRLNLVILYFNKLKRQVGMVVDFGQALAYAAWQAKEIETSFAV